MPCIAHSFTCNCWLRVLVDRRQASDSRRAHNYRGNTTSILTLLSCQCLFFIHCLVCDPTKCRVPSSDNPTLTRRARLYADYGFAPLAIGSRSIKMNRRYKHAALSSSRFISLWNAPLQSFETASRPFSSLHSPSPQNPNHLYETDRMLII